MAPPETHHEAETSQPQEENRNAPPDSRVTMPQAAEISNQPTGSPTKKAKWSLGMLETAEEVPGSILLLSKPSEYNAPLGMRLRPQQRTSASSFPDPLPTQQQSEAIFRSQHQQQQQQHASSQDQKKMTADGKIILEPQPDDSANDPLTWSALRRDAALLSLGFYCMVGGGMTPILAAGFTNVAGDLGVSIPQVALTTGLYMLGLGIGGVFASPTAILFGKRPVYLVTSGLFLLTAVWCALSPTYGSLVAARVVQGLVISPVECLPSASIAEIFFLHERAYRLGIYTLLLLGGKNLVPLVSAVIINSLGWRWVFWIVAIVVGFCMLLLFFFVPETFWDRTPRPHKHSNSNDDSRPKVFRILSGQSWSEAHRNASLSKTRPDDKDPRTFPEDQSSTDPTRGTDISKARSENAKHAHFADPSPHDEEEAANIVSSGASETSGEKPDDVLGDPEKVGDSPTDDIPLTLGQAYTNKYRMGPTRSYLSTLKPWSGRLSHVKWFRIALRPFILFAYPAILWSAAVYALSVGWLIVLSEAVAEVYRSRDTYNFTALQAGLVYISPFVGGILGSAVAGKISDILVRRMARRNGGIYEPEYRLVMALPIAISTVLGLMGFGWSAQERDAWIVPTVFFGIISFGCSLGSTTAITFAVDSYRQYAGEALVTLNFSKNIFHGFVFSLFFNKWLAADGSKDVFLAIGGIQLGFLLFTIPMYIYGKRARLWTVKRNFMDHF